MEHEMYWRIGRSRFVELLTREDFNALKAFELGVSVAGGNDDMNEHNAWYWFAVNAYGISQAEANALLTVAPPPKCEVVPLR